MARSGKSEARQSALRSLPSVDALLQRVQGDAALKGIPPARIVQAGREVRVGERGRLVEGVKRAGTVTPLDTDALARRVVAELSRAGAFSLAPVINATGVVLHTNLGRALLSPLALERLRRVGSAYSNLELDLKTKEGGWSYGHVAGFVQRPAG